jgi:hypothetical protein
MKPAWRLAVLVACLAALVLYVWDELPSRFFEGLILFVVMAVGVAAVAAFPFMTRRPSCGKAQGVPLPRWLLALLALSLLVLVFVVPRLRFVLPSNPRITEGNFRQLRLGMKRQEVEAILGPAGDYRTGPVRYEKLAVWLTRLGPTATLKWQGNETEIGIWLDASGTVVWATCQPAYREEVGTADWLKWAWKSWRNGR